MESVNLRIENWEKNEIEEISYSISLKVPPKEELLRLLPAHLAKLQYDWECRTGILSATEHSLKLCLYREYHEPKLGVFILIKNTIPSQVIEVRGVDITYVSQPKAVTVEDSMSIVDPPKPLEITGTEFWQSTCGWPDDTSIIFLVLHVIKRKPPRIINEDMDQLLPSGCLSQTGAIDIKPYFLSSECSDVTIQCGSTKFPAHQLILSNRSEYFSSMFSSLMRESRERIVKIEDMTPQTVKELLRFIYHGEIEHPELYAKDLFIAADKYRMDDLKGLCERHLLEKLSVENALVIYDLCQMHGSPLLLRKAKEIITWNKGKFAPDPETFKDFTCKYPELMFELFQIPS